MKIKSQSAFSHPPLYASDLFLRVIDIPAFHLRRNSLLKNVTSDKLAKI